MVNKLFIPCNEQAPEEVLMTEIMVLREANDRLVGLLQKICIARRNGQEIPLNEIESLIKSATEVTS